MRMLARGAGLLLLLVVAAAAAGAQEAVTISGSVFGAGQPLRDASVRIPALDMSTSTDASGRYSFIVPSSRVRGQAVTMEARQLRYVPQSVKIALVGGAVTHDFDLQLASGEVADQSPAGQEPRVSRTLTPDPLLWGAAPDLQSALSGRIAGLRVTSATTPLGSAPMVVRGPRSLASSNDPLVVVNGVPLTGEGLPGAAQRFGFGGFDFGNGVSDINPAGITSVQLLQGADAVARYGDRAANGVLLVTTLTGRGLNGMEVSASQRVMFESPLRLPSYQNQYGQGSGGLFEFFDGRGTGVNDSIAESWGPALQGQPVAQASYTERQRPEVRYWLPQPRNVHDYFDAGRTYVTDAAATGGSERRSYRVSARDMEVHGLAPSSDLSRRAISASGWSRLGGAVEGSLHARYISSSANDLPGTGFDPMNPVSALTRLGRQVDVSQLRAHVLDSADAQINWIYTSQNNPFFASQVNDARGTRGHATLGGALDWTATPWLSADLSASTDRWNESRDLSVAPGWLTGIQTDAGRVAFASGGSHDGTAKASTSGVNASLTAAQSATRPTRASITLGASLRSDNASLSTVTVDSAAFGQAAADWSQDTKAHGLFASTSGTLRNAFTLTASARQETQNWLAAGHQSQVYPAVSASLDARRALGMSPGVNALMLRGGWSRRGNALSPWLIRTMYAGARSVGDSALAGFAPVTPLASLEPEITAGWNAGADLRGFGDRAGVSFTFYHERTDGLIVPSFVTGPATPMAMNGGSVSNSGVETQLSVVPVRTHALDWTLTGNLTKNTSRVDDVPNGAVAMSPARWGASLEARNGYALGAIVGTAFARDAGGQLLLTDGLPVPAAGADSLRVLGTVAPDWFGGLSSTVRFGRFELYALADGQMGGSIFSATNLWGATSGNLAETAFRPDSGIVVAGVDAATGAANAVHVSTEDYYHALRGIAERWVYDASYVKLREVRVSTSLGLPSFAMFHTPTLRASLIGRNLALWARAPNIDPETAISATTVQGFELGQLPAARSIGLQLTLTP